MSVVRNLMVRVGSDFSKMASGLKNAQANIRNFGRSTKKELEVTPSVKTRELEAQLEQTREKIKIIAKTISKYKMVMPKEELQKLGVELDHLKNKAKYVFKELKAQPDWTPKINTNPAKRSIQSLRKTWKNELTDIISPQNMGLAALSYGMIQFMKDSSKEAMRLESAIGGINRMMGSSSNAFQQWAKNSAIAFNLSESDAMDYGRTFSSVISGFAKNSSEVEKYTEDILKTSAIIASGSGRSIDDVTTRLLSGLRGETDAVEDLSIYVNQSMIKNTNAFRRFAGDKSWSQLSFQTQQQILYFAELEQATKVYGTTLANTTANKLAQFTANLKNLQAEMGKSINIIQNSYLPALSGLLSAISALIKNSYDFGASLASGQDSNIAEQTTQIDTQKSAMQDYYAQLDDYNQKMKTYNQTTKATTKAQQGMVAGFDEVHQVIKETAADQTSLDKPIKPTMPSFPNQSKIEPKPIAPSTGSALGKWWHDNAESVLPNLLISPLMIPAPDTSKFSAGWETFKTDVAQKWEGIKTSFGGFGTVFVEKFKAIPDALKDSQLIKDIQTNAASVWTIITNVFSNVKTGVSSFFSKTFSSIGTTLKNIDLTSSANSIWTTVKNGFNGSKETVSGWFSTTFSSIGTTLKGIDLTTQANAVWTTVKNGFNGTEETVSGWFSTTWDSISTKLKDKTFLDSIEMSAKGVWGKVKSAFSEVETWFDTNVTKKITKAIETIKSTMSGGLVDGIKTLLNSFIDTLNSGFKTFNEFKNKIPGGTYIPSIPQIPKLAKGGIVDSPTMAMIGEAGPEMVVPLEQTSFTDKLAGALGTAVMSAMQMTGGSNMTGSNKEVVLKIDGYTIARALNPYLKKETNRQGNTIISIL